MAQGTGEAGIISSVNLDSGRHDVTLLSDDSDSAVKYVDLPVPYTIYMDDLNNLSEDLTAAQDTNSKTEEMLESKLLSLNLKKSSYIILGDTKERKRLKEEAVKKPLVLSEQKMTESEEIKYLGEIITNSLEESIHKTVMKRIGIANQAVYEITAVIEFKRSRSIGGINLAFIFLTHLLFQ